MNACMPLSLASFNVDVDRGDGELTLRFTGDANLHAVEAIARVLAEAHDEATAAGCARVVIDFLALEFMNSSCFKRFVTWINQAREQGASSYRIHMVSNPKMYWQRRSIRALQGLAVGLITIEE